VDIGAHARRARNLARLLLEDLDVRAPQLREVAASTDPLAPVLQELGITVSVATRVDAACSVAGSCDRAARSITVVQAVRPRMRFTALHELGHLLGDDHNQFQTQLYKVSGTTRREVEEDACEAFAAALLLPNAVVDDILSGTGVTARGVINLVAAVPSASREACAVAAAQRLRAPGYVMLVDDAGAAVFAARSGDALPVARGTSQVGSVLDPVLRTSLAVRDRGELLYRSGTRTPALHVDAAVDADGMRYVVGVTDQPDWPVLHTPDRTNRGSRMPGGCGSTRCRCGHRVRPPTATTAPSSSRARTGPP
jgi:hypothetical protein